MIYTDKYSMDINELESFKLSDAVKFHKELNPRLWQDEKLDKEVRDQLLLIAEDFVEYLGISNLKVKDVTISGSNAAYSYTPHSDLDLHILVDFNELPNNEVYQELFTAKKTLYNDAHDITVHGVPVELYVQDTNQPVQSLGEYSIVHDKWIRIPKKRRANFDEAATKAKYEKLGDLIELALNSKDPKRVSDTIALVKRYRKSGLDKHGEFGPENLAYKAVRKQGLVQALYDLKSELHAEKLSIEEASSREDAILKIKKLQNTQGRTPAEKENIKRIVSKMITQWNIDPSEIGVRQPVDPLKAKIAKAAYEKTAAADLFKQEWNRFRQGIFAEASGYIPSEKEKNDPRFKTALTVDVKPDSIKKNAKAFNWKTSRAGIPPQARPDGKIAEDLMKEWKSFLAEDQEQQELFPGYDEKHRQERLNAWLAKSQAVTANYKPKVLYHATTKHFDQFRAQNKGFASALGMTFEVDRSGIFLAENPKFAAEYIEDEYGAYKENAVIIPVYLSAQYTFDLTDNGLSPMLNDEALVEEFKEHDIDLRSIYYHIYEDQRWELFDGPEGEEFVANLKKLGYDSAYMYESSRHLGRNAVWVAFEPSQVKAITNRGSFSADDPRLMKENG